MANEDDVVLAFRQAVEDEMRRAQDDVTEDEILVEGASLDETVRRLVASHQDLEHEVKLLRTIILKLISQPVDDQA